MQLKYFFSFLILMIVLGCSKDDAITPEPEPVQVSKYTVTIKAGDGGTVSTAGGTYNKDSEVSVTATPNAEYLFESWSDGSTDNPRTIKVGADLAITANFVKKQYDLTVTVVGDGAVAEEVVIQGGRYNSGSQIKLTATAAEGWEFSSWTGAIESTDNPVTVNINEGKGVTATFIRKKYDLTITIEGEGTVTEEVVVQPGQYDYETQVKLTAVPAEGWKFTSWSGAIESTDNSVVIAIDEAKEIKAIFTSLNIQGGYDQPAKTNAKIAVIPISFADTSDEAKELFPTKNDLKDLIASEKLKNYFSTVSYGIFNFEVEVFDYYNLPFAGVVENTIYNSSIVSHEYTIANLNPEQFDYLMFVPVHDWGLGGGMQNYWELNINGINYPFGEINSFMVPIFIGNQMRDQSYPFVNSTNYRRMYSIPLGEESSEDGDIQYDFSNFENTFLHEFIHALGIQTHSMSKTNGLNFDYEPINPSNGGLKSLDYGDKFCVMGKMEYGASLTAAYRDYLGWHNETVRYRVMDFGTTVVDLYPINTSNDVAYIEIRIPGKVSEFDYIGYKNEGYFLEVRSQYDQYDSFLTNQHLKGNLEGVFVKKTDGYTSWLLDMSPSANINFYGQITPDIRDVVLKPDMEYENSDVRIKVISKNIDGSFTVEIELK